MKAGETIIAWPREMHVVGLLAVKMLLCKPCPGDNEYEIQQITTGPQHHLFRYIGHVGTIPWSGDGRYLLALRSDFQDHIPQPQEPADVVLIDTENDFQFKKVDESREWNLQQGTMFYWNSSYPETLFSTTVIPTEATCSRS